MALTKIPANLLDTSAHVDLLDNEQIRLGSSQDLRIYHDANNSYIKDQGTGQLVIDGNSVVLQYSSGTRLTTTSAGISVTGNISGATATASGGTNTTALASTAFVQQEITSLIGGAPGTLDTLNELAAAINDDSNYNSTLTTALATKLPLAGGTMTGNISITKEDPFITLTDSSSSRTLLVFNDNNNSVIRASGPLLLQVGSQSAITIDTSRNSAFAGNLDVAGTITGDDGLSIQGGTGNAYLQVGSDTGSWTWKNYRATHKLALEDSDGTGEVLNFDTSGNAAFAGTVTAGRIQPTEHIIFQSPTGYLQFPGASSRAWALASQGGTTTPGTNSATFGFHHWSGSAWTNPINITASGKLGIGTDNPGEKLEVNGILQIKRVGDHPAIRFVEDTTTRGYIGSGDWAINGLADADFGISSVGALALGHSGGVERMRIHTNGNVGIGITSPLVKLDVRGSPSAPATSGTAQTGSLRVSQTAGDGVLDMGFYTSATGTAWIQSTNKSNLAINYGLTLQPNGGNVGIGTTNPSYLVHADAIVSTDPSYIVAGSGSNFVMAMGSQNRPGVAQEAFIGTLSDERFKVKVNNVEKATFTSTGLGVGTSSPDALLEISHDATSHNPVLRLTGTDTGAYAAGIEWYSGYGPKLSAQMFSTASGGQGGEFWLNVRDQSTNALARRMYVRNNGNVAFGDEGAPARSIVVKSADSVTNSIQFQSPTTGNAAGDGVGMGMDSTRKAFIWNYEGNDIYIGGAGGTTMVFANDMTIGIKATQDQKIGKSRVNVGGVLVNEGRYANGKIGGSTFSSISNGWNFHSSASSTGGYTTIRFTVPDVSGGGAGNGYGSFNAMMQVAGYNGNHCFANFAGYQNQGVYGPRANIIDSLGGSWTASIGNNGSHGWYMQLTTSGVTLTHPSAQIILCHGGATTTASIYDLNDCTWTWS